ncbi:hypothetical protein [Protaetiibacter intestinalis]|uniref:Uncharacterized protein n=1 Tax=Protaetiibacter intestinalis TaxID=2419774 RepID=A0A387B7I6_9MICO|nr:hypothetical protein [Protaetiibacter intestinalis]AYF97046.1 hypothetical protein D7I47_01455 [Protaetiibacter intestinalis]
MPEPDYERELERLVRQLDRMALRVVGRDRSIVLNEGVEAFFKFQEDLFDFQIEVQRHLASLKATTRRSAQARKDAARFRQIRWNARRLGDALAWDHFNKDKQHIAALSHNDLMPIPSTKEDDGVRGTWLAARACAGPDWGIPLLHDITSCLRVGDITFLNVDRKTRKLVHHTVEVKSHRTATEPINDKTENITLQVTLITNEPMPEGLGEVKAAPAIQTRPRWQTDQRFRRQMQRMDAAVQHRKAKLNSINQIGDTTHLTLTRVGEDKHHWAELRRAIRNARKDGTSFFSVDGYAGYIVAYNPEGVTPSDFQRNFPKEALTDELHVEGHERNSMLLQTVPLTDEDASFASEVLPFYMYDIPKRAVSELLSGKLAIVSFLNIARVADALETLGYEIIPDPASGKADGRSFWTRATLNWPEGSFAIETPAPWRQMLISMHEFLGVSSVIAPAAATLDLPARIRFEDFQSSYEQFGSRHPAA